MNNELKDWINERTDGDLVMLCNEIYDWHESDILNPDSLLSKVVRDLNVKAEGVEEIVLNISAERLGKAVLLLLAKRPYMFLKSVTNK